MIEHEWQTCKDKDCDECQELINYGILMACDECDMPGYVDAIGCWLKMDDGCVLCLSCQEKEENNGI